MAKRARGEIAGEPNAATGSKRRARPQESSETSSSSKSAKSLIDRKKEEENKVTSSADEELNVEDLEVEAAEDEELEEKGAEPIRAETAPKRRMGVCKLKVGEDDCCFTGKPVPVDDARRRWPHRYPVIFLKSSYW